MQTKPSQKFRNSEDLNYNTLPGVDKQINISTELINY